MSGREFYTPEGLGAMEDQLTNALILQSLHVERYVNYTGSPEEGFDLYDSSGGYFHYPSRSGAEAGERATYTNAARDVTTQDVDVWNEHYGPWIDGVREAFRSWHLLPDERLFFDYAADIRAAGRHISTDLKPLADPEKGHVEPSDSSGTYQTLDTLDTRLGGEDYAGYAMGTFWRNYVHPMPNLIGQQYWLTCLTADLLHGAGELYQEARRKVMEIGNLATRAAGGEGKPDAGDVGDKVFSLIGVVAGAIAQIPFPPSQVPATLIAAGVASVDALTRGEKRPVHNGFWAPEPYEVMSKVRSALDELNSQIGDEERSLADLARSATDATYHVSTPTRVYFNLGPPEILNVANAPAIAMKIDFQGIEEAATRDMPIVVEALSSTSREMELIDQGPAPWTRSAEIGLGAVGPHKEWEALFNQCRFVLDDTAQELDAAADHLLLAAKAIKTSDESAQAELQRHTKDLVDSGVTAADPTGPR